MIGQISFKDILCSIAPLRIKLLKIIDYIWGGVIVFFLHPAKVKELSPGFKKVLIIRPGGMGDAVFLLPILKALKKENLIIDVLCEQRNVEVFVSQQHLLNKIYLYEKQLFEVLKVSYDVVVDTEQWHYLSAIVSYLLHAPIKIGFATRPRRAKLFNIPIVYRNNDYELDNFKELFRGLLPSNFTIETINECFDVPAQVKTWALGQTPERIVSVFLGGSITVRRLSVSQLLIIVGEILQQKYCPVLLGGEEMIKTSRQLISEINDPRILDLVGKTSLIQGAALIQRSTKFIGTDSGLMHLACAVGVPVIAIFGPGNLQKWGPKGPQHKIITEKVSCSPCTRFGYTIPSCQGRFMCMRELQTKNILEAIKIEN